MPDVGHVGTFNGEPPRPSPSDGLGNGNGSVANLISLPRVWFGLPTLGRKTETPTLTDGLDSAHSFHQFREFIIIRRRICEAG